MIAQGYFSTRDREAAPAGKAGDLNTAVSWMLDPHASVPDGLAAAAAELRSSVEDDAITQIEVWYCHNLPESSNVQSELDQVCRTVRAQLSLHYADSRVESIRGLEVGRCRLEEWYRASRVAILVPDSCKFAAAGGFEVSGDTWSAYCTSIAAADLRALYERHGTSLFSANVRDYLGSRRSDRNINNNIKQTAETTPTRFWAYNNGVTALVNDYAIAESGDEVTVQGISIVNGAQTTGAVGSIDSTRASALDQARVLVRFVKSSDPGTVRDIVRFNNSQNKVEAPDFRSNDSVQQRLRQEFSDVPDAEYRGARRGGERDIIERPAGLLPSDTVAQALAAFHQDPNVAYNEKSKIWTVDGTYARYFNETTTAAHIVFAFSLLRAVEEAKRALVEIPDDSRTEEQRNRIGFFRLRGSIFLTVTAVSHCMESFLGRVIADPVDLRFKKNVSVKTGMGHWRPIVGVALAFSSQLEGALERNLQNRERVTEALRAFKSLVEATRQVNGEVFRSFASTVAEQRSKQT